MRITNLIAVFLTFSFGLFAQWPVFPVGYGPAQIVLGADNLTTSGAVAFVDNAGILTQDAANLFWDNANNRLGIGTNAPTTALSVVGTITATSFSNGTNTAVLGGNLITTAGSVPYVSSAGVVTQDNANLFWDSANYRLGIGTASPAKGVHVVGSQTTTTTPIGQEATAIEVVNTSAAALPRRQGIYFSGIVSQDSARFAGVSAETTGSSSGQRFGDLILATKGALADTELFDRLRVTGAGNVVVGATTPGGWRFDVGRSGTNGTMRVWDQLATTGVTRMQVRAGAGQSTTDLQQWQDASGSVLAQIQSTGGATIQGLTIGRGGGAIASNTAVGASALATNTTGGFNTASGISALFSNTTGNFNTASGNDALRNNTTGNSNTASGSGALRNNTTGSFNTASGDSALRVNTTGNNNTASGGGAGYTANIANANTTGSNNTWIGYQSGPGSPTQRNNSVAIGYQALVDASNAGVLGTAGMKWSVGGVQAPATTFHVEDTTASTGVTNVLVKAGAGQSTTDLQQWQASGGTVLARVTSGGDIAFRIATWGSGTEGTCDATTRGQVVMVQGGAGVADTLRICRKDAANAYAWTALY
jgi:hypothetical protein